MLFGAGGASAAPVLLSDLIDGRGELTAGDLSFSGFLAAAPNTVDPTTVEVSPFFDALGRAGLQFSSPLSIANGGGSKEIVADFLFTVTETSASTLHGLTQAFAADVTGSGISAFDFTRAGVLSGSLVTLAGNCINGDFAGCSQITGPTDSGLMGDVAVDEVERDVQLVRSRGGSGTGDLASWTVAFSETPATSAVPEPSSWLLMVVGVAGLGLAGRRRRGSCRGLRTA